jgi:hypothetical protein
MYRTKEKSMEARFARVVYTATFLICLCPLSGRLAEAASGYRTANFTVSAPTPALAKEIGDTAEQWRKQLAVEWLGAEMPPWDRPCPIRAQVAPNMGAGGATSFVFDRGQVFDWNMNIQGSRERILDSVLPHEITHTIFASYFRQPLPRWADEGACTTVEHKSEVAKQEQMLIKFLKGGRGIAFSQMFAMTEYPPDVMPLYSQGHSLSQWLIESRGRKAFLEFLGDGMNDDNWPRAVERHYGFANLAAMQDAWLEWVKAGRPRLTPETSTITQQLARQRSLSTASAAPDAASRAPASVAIYRGQSPDAITPIGAAELSAPSNITGSPSSTSTMVASGDSIYAATAARAAQERRQSADPAPPGPTSGASAYDASRNVGVLRR